MVVFLDQYDNEYGAQATLQVTNAVNGERSLKGTIVTNDDVLNTIEKGWKMQFDDEYYRIIYAEPVDLGNKKQVEFDAVHQFFYDFDKSSVHSQLADGSHTFETYLNFIFDGSGYTYRLEVDVKAFEKQSFGYKSRLSLFNNIITQAGVEFSVSGKVVRILKNVGTDLSTIVRKNFNMDDLKLKKNINDFITYQKGFGAWDDENDHSKGRLEVEYESPLAKEYGRIEGEPVVDERYKVAENLKEVLKKNVESSYTVSVELTMEDLTKAGYKYQQPVAGDYIMAINEALDFHERIRIVSFTSEYDVTGKLLNHKVTCNDVGQVKKQSASYSNLSKQVSSNQNELSELAKIANRALVSADGKNTNYYGTTMPVDSPKGTLKKGDLLFLTVGDVTKQYVWNGSEWIINPYSEDIDWVKTHIEEDIKPQLVQMDEDIKATDQKAKDALAQIGEQADIVETNKLATQQAQADATRAIQDAQTVAGQLNSTKTSLQTEINQAKQATATVAGQLDSAKSELQAAITAADKKAVDANTSISQARNELNAQASQLRAQAQAQSELTKRVSSVETLADGTRTSLSELSKTVSAQSGKIDSVTSRTKTVEDTLAGTKTKLEQVSQTLNGATGDIATVSRKTAELESGLNGVNSKFEKLSIGGRNLLRGTRNFDGDAWDYALNRKKTVDWRPDDFGVIRASYPWEGVAQPVKVEAGKTYTFSFDVAGAAKNTPFLSLIELERQSVEVDVNVKTFTADEYFQRYHHTFTARGNGVVYPRVETSDSQVIYYRAFKVEKGNVATDYSEADEDFHQQIAEYKQTAEQNLANLSSTVQALDGTVTQNKTSQEQTASAFKSRLTSLETYKDGEATRAKQYFEANKTETAKQITAERTATAQNYLAKSTYQEDYTGVTRRLTATETVANGAKTNADKAQTTADSAVTNARTAQDTANSAVSKADSAQASANSANSGVTTVTQKLATYQNTNDKRVASLEQSSQTTAGQLTSLSNTLTQTARETRESISAVEAKIPTAIDGQNLFKGTRSFSGDTWNYNPQNKTIASWKHDDFTVLKASHVWEGISQLIQVKTGETYTFSFVVASSANNDTAAIFITLNDYRTEQKATVDITSKEITVNQYWTRQSVTFTVLSDGYIAPRVERRDTNATLYLAAFKLERSSIASDWSPAYEDTMTEISNAKLAITKNAEGLKLVADKASSNEGTLSQHTTQITAINNELSAKVAKTDYDKLTGRMTSAETTIQAQAGLINQRLTATQTESLITSKGYQTKSDIDKNINNRQLVTTSVLTNQLQETVNGYTREISRVETKLSNSLNAPNLMTGTKDWSGAWNYNASSLVLGSFERNGFKVVSASHMWGGISQLIQVQKGKTYTFSFDAASSVDNDTALAVISLNDGQSNAATVDITSKEITVNQYWTRQSVTFTVLSDGYIAPRVERRDTNATLYLAGFKLAEGYSKNWSSNASDLVTTTDLQKVTSTVEEHTRKFTSIDSGIGDLKWSEVKQTVSKVTSTIGDSTAISRTVQSALVGLQEYKNLTSGLSTVQSQMAGSWAVKNLNASGDVLSQLNLNNGNVKIEGKLVRITGTTVIDDAVITSAMLKEVSADKVTSGTFDANKVNVINLNANKIVGLDAAFIKAKIENALIDWMKGKVIQSQNGNTKLNLMNGRLYTSDDNAGIFRVDDNASIMGLKFVNTNTTINGNARKVSRVIIGGDRRAGSSDADFGWDRGGFTGIVMSTIKGEASDVSWENDDIQLVGDRVVFTHSYYDDTDATGARTGWQMYNYVGTSPRQSYVNLRPYNIANNLSILDVGDVRLWVNGNQEYSLRTALNKLKQVFVHIKNGGFSDSARNAIITTLNEMDGMKI